MRLHRFYIEETIADALEIIVYNKELIHQWMKVFRYKTGDEIYIFDNSGFEYLSKFENLNKNDATIKIIEKSEVLNKPKQNIWLFQSLIKKDNFEWVVEKGTELGVNVFYPVESERSEKKSLNLERVKKIAIEASEQSGRGVISEIKEVLSLKEALEICKDNNFNAIAFHLDGEKINQSKFSSEKIAIFIGPEGGWSEKEISLFKENNISIYSLGSQVLRAETAAIVACAKFLT